MTSFWIFLYADRISWLILYINSFDITTFSPSNSTLVICFGTLDCMRFFLFWVFYWFCLAWSLRGTGVRLLTHNMFFVRMKIGHFGSSEHYLQDLLHSMGLRIHLRSHGTYLVWDIILVLTSQRLKRPPLYITMVTWSHGWRLQWPNTDHTGQSTSSMTTPIFRDAT